MPHRQEVLRQVLVRPAASDDAALATALSSTALSSTDALVACTTTVRVFCFAQGGVDAAALEIGLHRTLEDLPLLAGRLGRRPGAPRLRLGSLEIQHTSAGALLTLASAPTVTVADVGPDRWPWRSTRGGAPGLPFYANPLDPLKLATGREPLLKVRLTALHGGAQILAISLCHAVCDCMRWPRLLAHLSARYREAAGGAPPDPADLLCPGDRALLSVAALKRSARLDRWQPPESTRVKGSFRGYARAAAAMLAAPWRRLDLAVLHVPQEAVAALKAAAAAANPAVTTGDAVQAAAALLIHAAMGRPLLPVAPKAITIMLQTPAAPEFFGNAVRMLPVSLPAGTAQPTDFWVALGAVASAIRAATVDFRTRPEVQLEGLAEAEALVAAPLPRLAAHVHSLLSCLTAATNYMPATQSLDLGAPLLWAQQLSRPVGSGMTIIRPAAPPYPEGGFFFQLCLPRAAATRLRGHTILPALPPTARWVGEAGGREAAEEPSK